MRFKKDDDGKLVLDDAGDPIAITETGDVIPLDKVVSLGKHQRIETERDEYKGQVEKLQAQIGDLQKVAGDKDELEKKLSSIAEESEKTKSELEGRLAERDKAHALDTALLKAGCRDTKAARAHIDMEGLSVDGDALKGFDADAFKKDKPYLFEASQTVATAAPSRGAVGPEDANETQMRQVMGLTTENKE